MDHWESFLFFRPDSLTEVNLSSTVHTLNSSRNSNWLFKTDLQNKSYQYWCCWNVSLTEMKYTSSLLLCYL